MNDDFEITRGSGNVFHDLGHTGADLEHLRSILAAQIVEVLQQRKMTVRAAQAVTGVAASDFSCIRQANLSRFTVDRLMTVLEKLGSRVVVNVTVSNPVLAATTVPHFNKAKTNQPVAIKVFSINDWSSTNQCWYQDVPVFVSRLASVVPMPIAHFVNAH